jgi:hypothetical protein
MKIKENPLPCGCVLENPQMMNCSSIGKHARKECIRSPRALLYKKSPRSFRGKARGTCSFQERTPIVCLVRQLGHMKTSVRVNPPLTYCSTFTYKDYSYCYSPDKTVLAQATILSYVPCIYDPCAEFSCRETTHDR